MGLSLREYPPLEYDISGRLALHDLEIAGIAVMEKDPVAGMAKMIEEDVPRGQSGMAAKTGFPGGGKPADGEGVIFGNKERHLREPAFHGDTLQGAVGEPFRKRKDAGQIGLWGAFCKRGDLIYMHIQIYDSSIPTESLLYFRL